VGGTAHDVGCRVEVRGTRWPHPLHLPHVWLRDHCRCSSCYDAATSQRIFDIADLPLQIRPARVQLEEDTLHLTWPDGHVTEYSLQFLWQNFNTGRSSAVKDSRQPWKKLSFPPQSTITVTEQSLMEGKQGLQQLLYFLHKYGLVFVSDVEPTKEATQAVVEAVAPIRETFYEKVWHMHSGEKAFADSAYSSVALGAHTDNSYLGQPSRLQVFHITKMATEGGDTLLVDGLSVARIMEEKHPEAFEFFSTKHIPSEYIDSTRHFRALYKVFEHDPQTGLLERFSYNPYDRAPLSSLSVTDTEKFYEHFKHLRNVVNKESSETWIKLAPGTVMIVDNWRVMHGRSGFRGARSMAGCYVGDDHYRSTVATGGLPQ